MLFRQKGWLKKKYNEQLMKTIIQLKEDWNRKRDLVEKSVEPSPEVLYDLKLAEAKYFFLLREAKKRQVTIKKFEI
ncbi:YaaL family protein [Bacillus sp. FJAT-47783]|uniref:YaaL family protein n=1 Tax=Bacillus sp. FJAT-47783 TaxID=2922712 RepID=UPI001FABAB7E|nr:YaaL family protein [Bacillus sp. FJAT-47783]